MSDCNQAEPLVVSFRIAKVAKFGKLVYNIYSCAGGSVWVKNMTIFRPKVTTNVVHYYGCVACIHDNKTVILSVVGHVGVACFTVLSVTANRKPTCRKYLTDGNIVTKFTIRIVFFDTIYSKTELQ